MDICKGCICKTCAKKGNGCTECRDCGNAITTECRGYKEIKEKGVKHN